MADKTYDAVIIGGGCKGLSAAIYLAKYGGMSVGIFERRHELGGALSSHEAPAPGFIGDPHATNTALIYYIPIEEDFPDFVDKGGKQGHYKASTGVILRENQKCCTIYHLLEDPTQERTAAEIARFSGEKDAETYLKIWNYAEKTRFDIVSLQTWYDLPPAPGEPGPEERWLMDWFKQPDCPVDPEWRILPPIVAYQQLFDSFGLSLIWLRRGLASGSQPVEPYGGLEAMRWLLAQPSLSFIIGGTHSVAHAYIRIFLENGGEFFTHSHVDEIIVENGTAKGIRLSDGTEIEARKLVLSTASPHQLCFQLLGGQDLSERILTKVKHLRGGNAAISWATWAHREAVNFQAADFNPDINETQNVTLGSEDPELWYREYYLRKLGKIPPIDGMILHHSYTGVDRSRVMPERGHTTLTETFLPAANALTEQEWLEYKKTYMEDVVREWQVYTTNMTWDNIIGCDPLMPYDTAARLINMAPWGDWSIYDIESWRPMSMRPVTEFAHHRIANIKNLYGTGAPWGQGSGQGDAGYRAYKAIAEDLGLTKPWKEKGRPY